MLRIGQQLFHLPSGCKDSGNEKGLKEEVSSMDCQPFCKKTKSLAGKDPLQMRYVCGAYEDEIPNRA
jgi:hypothetical protein